MTINCRVKPPQHNPDLPSVKSLPKTACPVAYSPLLQQQQLNPLSGGKDQLSSKKQLPDQK